MTDARPRPRLTLAHSTLAVRDLPTMVAFYTEVLGFLVTDRGQAGPDSELVFLSQDPGAHHQIVLVSGMEVGTHQFVLADHLAFRVPSLDDLQAIAADLAAAKVPDVLTVSHGNAWSVYFTDPEGNGLECFVDTPFHVAQPYLQPADLTGTEADLIEATRRELEGKPGFQAFATWSRGLADRLAESGS